MSPLKEGDRADPNDHPQDTEERDGLGVLTRCWGHVSSPFVATLGTALLENRHCPGLSGRQPWNLEHASRPLWESHLEFSPASTPSSSHRLFLLPEAFPAPSLHPGLSPQAQPPGDLPAQTVAPILPAPTAPCPVTPFHCLSSIYHLKLFICN